MRPRSIRYVLVTDGSSDSCLSHPIRWLLESMGWYEVEGQWAELRAIPEADPLDHRLAEICDAVSRLGPSMPHVCIVPVRMTEAWLLHDEAAIRAAAGRPRGRTELKLPAIKKIEQLANPKKVLHDALLSASEATGRLRKRKHRDFGVMRARVAELIQDYGPLRTLDAFSRFEQELRSTLESM